MKKIILIIFVLIFLFSCKSNKHLTHDTYSLGDQSYNDTLSRSQKIIQSVNEDFRIVDTWTEEEKAYFYEHFVFSYEELEEKVGIKLK
jgi:archaellum component FlaG (FlaF/FlaG flagellin family)